MFGIGVAELVVVGLIVTVPLVVLFLMIFANRKGGNAASAEETQLVQELLQGLRRLEERMNSLETILLQRGRKD
jgi:phage shock protein B